MGCDVAPDSLTLLQTFIGRFRRIMDSSQNSYNEDTSALVARLDEMERGLFQIGQKGLNDFQSWEKGQASQITASSLVQNYKKRKFTNMEDWTALQLVDLSLCPWQDLVNFMGDPTVDCCRAFDLQQAPSLELPGWGQMCMPLILLVFLDFSYLLFHSEAFWPENAAEEPESIWKKDLGHRHSQVGAGIPQVPGLVGCKGQVQSGSSLPVHKFLLSLFASPSSWLDKGYHPHHAARLLGLTPVSKTVHWEEREVSWGAEQETTLNSWAL